jgi:hypothetical protein
MARSVFFSFHYQKDIWRVSRVRNSWVTQERTTNTFLDSAEWESVQKKGDATVKRWIDKQLNGTSVIVVLIGAETATRKYVCYEIQRGITEKKGFLGIRIHQMKDSKGNISPPGENPLNLFSIEHKGWLFTTRKPLSSIFKTYDWIDDNGYNNINNWIEEAAKTAGR